MFIPERDQSLFPDPSLEPHPELTAPGGPLLVADEDGDGIPIWCEAGAERDCFNGIDDNHSDPGRVYMTDYYDPSCRAFWGYSEWMFGHLAEQGLQHLNYGCHDGYDNDEDGKLDWEDDDCIDPDLAPYSDENTYPWYLATEACFTHNPFGEPGWWGDEQHVLWWQWSTETYYDGDYGQPDFLRCEWSWDHCHNGEDDNHNGVDDENEPSCEFFRAEHCNTLDDDEDGHIDEGDTCDEEHDWPIEQCSDGEDQDGDMLIDCDDPDCHWHFDSVTGHLHVPEWSREHGIYAGQTTFTTFEHIQSSLLAFSACDEIGPSGDWGRCFNGVDDDGNGETDCDDLQCRAIAVASAYAGSGSNAYGPTYDASSAADLSGFCFEPDEYIPNGDWLLDDVPVR